MATLDLTNRAQVPSRGTVSGSEEIVVVVGSTLYVVSASELISKSATSVEWADILGRPSTFTPSPHTHVVGDIVATGSAGGTTFLRGDGSWKDISSVGALIDSNNLSDVASVSTARTNLGLGNVDNTSDANKPVSTAQQTALNLKANLASPTFTGVPVAPTAVTATNTTQIATTEFVNNLIDFRTPVSVAKSISGLVIANDVSNPDDTILIYPGAARDRDNSSDIILNNAIRKTTGTWSAGDLGGLIDVGAVSPNSAYHIFVIRNSVSGNVDIVASLSANSPTLPTGFNNVRRIGIINTDENSEVVRGLWRADGSFEFQTPTIAAPGGRTLDSNGLLQVLLNSGIKLKFIGYFAASGNSDFSITARDPDVGALPPSSYIPGTDILYKHGDSGDLAGVRSELWTDNSGRIYIGSNTFDASNTAYVFGCGWLDLRDEYI